MTLEGAGPIPPIGAVDQRCVAQEIDQHAEELARARTMHGGGYHNVGNAPSPNLPPGRFCIRWSRAQNVGKRWHDPMEYTGAARACRLFGVGDNFTCRPDNLGWVQPDIGECRRKGRDIGAAKGI